MGFIRVEKATNEIPVEVRSNLVYKYQGVQHLDMSCSAVTRTLVIIISLLMVVVSLATCILTGKP